jgi:hypothetical protein
MKAMVTFKEKSFVIEVYTGYNPIDGWQQLHKSLCDLLATVNDDNITERHYAAVGLLAELMPDIDTANKMVGK